MIREHDLVVLTEDLAADGIEAGDVGTVVHVFDGAKGYLVEFTTVDGRTVAVTEVRPDQLRPIELNDVSHARRRKTA